MKRPPIPTPEHGEEFYREFVAAAWQAAGCKPYHLDETGYFDMANRLDPEVAKEVWIAAWSVRDRSLFSIERKWRAIVLFARGVAKPTLAPGGPRAKPTNSKQGNSDQDPAGKAGME